MPYKAFKQELYIMLGLDILSFNIVLRFIICALLKQTNLGKCHLCGNRNSSYHPHILACLDVASTN